MIPFGSARGILIGNGSSVDFALDTLSPLGFTFRLFRGVFPMDLLSQITIVIDLLHNKGRHQIALDKSEISLTTQEENRQSILYHAETTSAAYQKLTSQFIRDYQVYLCMRQEEGVEAVSKRFLGVPEAPPTMMGGHAYMQQMMKVWSGTRIFSQVDVPFFLCLQTPREISSFLSHTFADFLSGYCDRHNLSKEVLQNSIRGVCLGHAYCSQVFPDLTQLLRQIKRAHQQGLQIMLELPTVRTCEQSRFARLLHCLEARGEPIDEISVNDWGMAYYIGTQTAFSCSAGRLLLRQTKDPREAYMRINETPSQSYYPEFYMEYLVSRGMRRAAMEASVPYTSPVPIPFSLFLPCFQLATSGDCILKNLMETGNRGTHRPQRTCAKYCQSEVLLYPEHMKTIGIGNTLCTLNSHVMTDMSVLSRYMGESCDRLVLDFPW